MTFIIDLLFFNKTCMRHNYIIWNLQSLASILGNSTKIDLWPEQPIISNILTAYTSRVYIYNTWE